MKVLLTGGGTGGHLYPGLAIVEEIKKDIDIVLLFAGTKHGIESRIIPGKGIDFKTIWISGLQRGRIFSNLLFPLKMVVSLIQAIFLVLVFKPDIVIGTGGYVTWPVNQAAILLRIKNVLHEQNLSPGLVTRKLSTMSGRVFLSFESSKQYFKQVDNLIVSGNPTRSDLKKGDPIEAANFFRLKPNMKTLFIFGGSQGARDMNRALLPVIEELCKGSDIQVIWSTGPRWYDEISGQIENENIKVYPYIERMDLAYAVSNLIVCRAGATTLAEINSLGLPSILIPFPGAADNHQEKNAGTLAEAGASLMIQEKQIPVCGIDRLIIDILNDEKKLKNMAENSQKFGRPQAAEIIKSEILSYCEIGERE